MHTWLHSMPLYFNADEGSDVTTYTLRSSTNTESSDTSNQNQCPSCSASNTLTAIFTAIATAIVSVAIFVLVQIALCKCCLLSKFTPSDTASAASAGEKGQAAKNWSKGYRTETVTDPIYMEVGAAKENALQLKQNAAYGTGRELALD